MAEANPEHLLPFLLQFPQQIHQIQNPRIIPVRIAAAPGYHESLEPVDLVNAGELSVRRPEQAPLLPFLPQHPYEIHWILLARLPFSNLSHLTSAQMLTLGDYSAI